MADPSPDVRWTAVRDAATGHGSVATLSRALIHEGDARVREAIFTALVKLASSESIDVLLQSLRSDESHLRTGAMDALRTAPAVIAVQLPLLLADADSDVRLLACDLARELDGAVVQGLLCALIDSDPQPNVCAAAIEVLTEIGDGEALPSLARCADRFPDDPFLLFAIAAASERLSAPRG
ncbi:MAG: HEAT repeat domain-containing protein [Rhizomicrobium sp.]